MTNPLRIAIVGYGTAGQALAVALGRDGHAVEVFERVPEPGPIVVELTPDDNAWWMIAAPLLVAAILLISTTIRLSAMSREQETQIMRYVGASNLFIQAPFMIEGALAALVGALVGGLIGLALYALTHIL